MKRRCDRSCQYILEKIGDFVICVSVTTTQQRICERFREQVLPCDNTNHLIVVIDNTKETQSQGSEKSICALRETTGWGETSEWNRKNLTPLRIWGLTWIEAVSLTV